MQINNLQLCSSKFLSSGWSRKKTPSILNFDSVVFSPRSCLRKTLKLLLFLSGAHWGDRSGREWLNKFQWVCLAYDEVGFCIQFIKIRRNFLLFSDFFHTIFFSFLDLFDWFLGRSKTLRSRMRSGRHSEFLIKQMMDLSR